MEKTVARLGLLNGILLLCAALCAAWLARDTGLASAMAVAAWAGLGFLVALVSWFRMHLQNRERLEAMEFEEISRDRRDAAIFAREGEEDTFPARRARHQFDRYFVPAWTVLLLLAQVGAAWFLWGWLPGASAPDPARAGIAMAAFSVIALVFYLVGRYSTGMARIREGTLLGPGSAHLLLGSLTSLFMVGVMAASWAGFQSADLWVGRLLTCLLVLGALECLIQLILELYRPRTRKDQARALYESRLVGLLCRPGGLVTTVAQALDYQFGFRVSETWFYRFLERSLAWLLLLQFSILLLFTTFVVLEPGERGLLERLGRQVESRGVLQPGLHFKLPWPVDRVRRLPAESLRNLSVGYRVDEDDRDERTLLWTTSHYSQEDNFLVASSEGDAGESETVPVSLLVAAIPVQYRIADPEAWIYEHRDPEALMEAICHREVVRHLVSVDLIEIMSTGRLAAAEALKDSIGRAARDAGLGVEVLFVGLQDIHPPVGSEQVKVAEAFEEVIGAVQERESSILEAEGEREKILPLARAEARRLISEAKAGRTERIEAARAAAARFRHQSAAVASAPEVFRHRKYFEVVATAFTNSRKYIIVPETSEDTFELNLEDTIAYDLLEARPEER